MKQFVGIARKCAAVFALGFAMLAQPACAYTECSTTITQIFSGDDGFIWFYFGTGGSAYLTPNDPDKQSTLSMAMTALVGGRQVVARFAADNVACNSTARSDFIGMYLK